jgi:serine protease Do
MRYFLIIFIVFVVASCSKPTQFLVKSIKNSQTIELEDGTIVKLIGVNNTNSKYIQGLQGLQNNYVTLYDENYDPVKTITEVTIMAYVYDDEGNCINDYANDSNGGQEVDQSPGQSNIDLTDSDMQETERISGKSVESMPGSSLSEMYEKNKNAVFLIAVPQTEEMYAQGTGFFISSSGIGVSNFHVFEDGDKENAIIKTADNHQYRLKSILKSDKELDFIVFEVENDHNDFPYLVIANTKTGVGEDVFAIGNPRGLEHTLSRGIVSSYRENETMIQTTTEITHGSSGGPLFNMKGEVIGITTSGVGEANLNFAMNLQKLGIVDLLENQN